jgi:hypothetical protein
MKRIALVVVIAAAALLAGCMFYPVVVASGTPATADYAVSDVTALQVSQSFAVSVVPDSSYSVTVTYDDNLASFLQVEKQGSSTLVIGLKQGYSYQGATLKAVVHLPYLKTLDASGASSFAVASGFGSLGTLTVTLSGASTLQYDGLDCTDLVLDLSGASDAALAGTAGAVDAMASGASTVYLRQCTAAAATVDLSGASQATLYVPGGTIGLTASGASVLYYAGSPTFGPLDLSGASTVVKLD